VQLCSCASLFYSLTPKIIKMARGRNSHHGAGGGALLACDRAMAKTGTILY
jgi:hypothetical protein